MRGNEKEEGARGKERGNGKGGRKGDWFEASIDEHLSFYGSMGLRVTCNILDSNDDELR